MFVLYCGMRKTKPAISLNLKRVLIFENPHQGIAGLDSETKYRNLVIKSTNQTNK